MAYARGEGSGKRKDIIRAAVNVFAACGFHEAKVEDIAAAAGVGKGTVYEYFSSKKELFREMLIEIANDYFLRAREQIDKADSTCEKLQAAIIVHLRFLEENKEMAQLFMTNHSAMGEEMHRWFCTKREKMLEIIADVMRWGINRGELCPTDPVLASKMFFGTMIVVAGDIILERTADIEQVAVRITDLFLHGAGNE